MSKKLFAISFAAIALIITGCEDPGVVGERFSDDDANLVTSTVDPGAITDVQDNSYTGKLSFMAIGRYDDAAFGEIESTGLLLPSISTANVSSIDEDALMRLRLVLDGTAYGDTTAAANFNIYRVDQIWRGNQLRYGDQVSYDETALVGQFTIDQSDTILVDLDDSWIEDYNSWLTSEESNRDSLYRNNFFGLAIVPQDASSNISFPKIRPGTGEDESDFEFVRFIVEREVENDDGEMEIETNYQTLLDWGMTLNRTPGQTSTIPGYKVHNFLDNFLQVDLDLDEEKLVSKNLANVELVLFEDRETLDSTLPAGHVRPEIEFARIHIIDADRKSDFIFNRSPAFVAQKDSVDQGLRFNITNYANTVLFGTPEPGNMYVSVESINGLIYSTILHNGEIADELRPKIVVTAVKSPEN